MQFFFEVNDLPYFLFLVEELKSLPVGTLLIFSVFSSSLKTVGLIIGSLGIWYLRSAIVCESDQCLSLSVSPRETADVLSRLRSALRTLLIDACCPAILLS